MGCFAEQIAEIIIQVAQQETHQEGQNRADEGMGLKSGQAGAAQNQHGNQRTGFKRHQHKSAGFFLGAVLLHDGGIQAAVGHIHNRDQGQHGQAGEEPGLDAALRQEQRPDGRYTPGYGNFGQNQGSRFTQHSSGCPDIDARAHTEKPNRQNGHSSRHQPVGEGAEVLAGIR
ncbi:hypothetical protein D3C75_971520 [compost metagenome]